MQTKGPFRSRTIQKHMTDLFKPTAKQRGKNCKNKMSFHTTLKINIQSYLGQRQKRNETKRKSKIPQCGHELVKQRAKQKTRNETCYANERSI